MGSGVLQYGRSGPTWAVALSGGSQTEPDSGAGVREVWVCLLDILDQLMLYHMDIGSTSLLCLNMLEDRSCCEYCIDLCKKFQRVHFYHRQADNMKEEDDVLFSGLCVPVWSRRVSYWPGSGAAGHHGGKTDDQQRPWIHLPVNDTHRRHTIYQNLIIPLLLTRNDRRIQTSVQSPFRS